jgi:vacuolar-type H+-ATPase subunit H
VSDDEDTYDEYEDDELELGEEDELPNPYAVPQVELLLEEAIEILAEARPLPMSTTVKVSRDELLHILEQAQEQLPEEVRAARWLLKEREEFVARARREHQALIDEGRAQVSRMVERQQVVKDAEARARQILDDAQTEANTMKRQVEEFCDRKLARFESVLLQTTDTVQKGRQKLLGMSEVRSADNGDWSDDWDDDSRQGDNRRNGSSRSGGLHRDEIDLDREAALEDGRR